MTAALLLVLALAPTPGRVALVPTEEADPVTAEALHRIAGELAADGLATELVPAGGDVLRAAATPGVLAAVSVVHTRADLAEIHMASGAPPRESIHAVALRGAGGPLIAIRAAELIHALREPPPPPPVRPPPDLVEEEGTERARAPTSVVPSAAIALGIGVLSAPSPIGAMFTPTLSLSYGPPDRDGTWRWLARLTGAGLGPRSVVAAGKTPARVQQGLLLLEAVALRPYRWLVPLAEAGAGIHLWQLETGPADRRTSSLRGTLVGSVGLGLFVPLWGRLGISLEGRGIVVATRYLISTDATFTTVFPQPAFLATAALAGALR